MSTKEAKHKAQQKYALKNKDKIAARQQAYREANTAKFIVNAAKNRAMKKGIECTIEEDDIVIPTHCPILGIPLRMNSGRKGGKDDSYSLDRIDPSKGYVKDNVQVISFRANMMKSDASKEDLIKFYEWIGKTYL